MPAPRRKTQPPALFTQVLDNINGSSPKPPTPIASLADTIGAADVEEKVAVAASAVAVAEPPRAPAGATVDAVTAQASVSPREDAGELRREEPQAPEAPDADVPELEGGFRRSLIRATFPRPEGQAPPQRTAPEFTIQSLHNRRNNNQRNAGGPNKFRGGRRRPGGANLDNIGPMRFRDQGGPGQDRQQGPGGGGGGRRRRGGKKNR
ncbi:MAG TPA: hypothetical protein VEA16_06110 [Vicinamibacterales bacterium]|nr:hypothetical protein [Vicinamibacterales bacterium]